MKIPEVFRPRGLDPELFDAARTLARGATNAPDLCFGVAVRVLRALAQDADPRRTADALAEVVMAERSVMMAEEAEERERRGLRAKMTIGPSHRGPQRRRPA